MKFSAIILILIFFISVSFAFEKLRREDDATAKDAAKKEEPKQDGIKLAKFLKNKENKEAEGPHVIIQQTKEYASLTESNALDFEDLCKLKQGYVALINKLVHNQDKSKPEIIIAKPVFAVLNEKTLAFFENENVGALIASIDIKHLKAPQRPKSWSNLHCFQLVRGNGKEIKDSGVTVASEVPIAEAASSICLINDEQMESWMNAIANFHNCVVKEVTEEELKLEPASVKIRRKAYEDEEKKEIEEAKKDQEQSDQDNKNSEAEDDQQNKAIDDQLSEVKKQIVKSKMKRNNELRKTDEERKKTEDKTKKLEDEQKCLEKALETKAVEEENAAEILIKEEEIVRDKGIIAKASKAILDQTDKSNHMLEEQKHTVIDNQKKIQEMIKNSMIQTAVNYEKFLDPSECFDPALISNQEKHMGKVCAFMQDKTHMDIVKLNDCLNIKKFCKVCCEDKIGAAHEQEKVKCEMRCNKLVDPQEDNKKETLADGMMTLKVPVQNEIPKEI